MKTKMIVRGRIDKGGKAVYMCATLRDVHSAVYALLEVLSADRIEIEPVKLIPEGPPMKCDYCGEEIEEGKRANVRGAKLHVECSIRTVVGSLLHQMRLCSCFVPGSAEGDPPQLSTRNAAILADLFWRMQNDKRQEEKESLEKDCATLRARLRP